MFTPGIWRLWQDLSQFSTMHTSTTLGDIGVNTWCFEGKNIEASKKIAPFACPPRKKLVSLSVWNRTLCVDSLGVLRNAPQIDSKVIRPWISAWGSESASDSLRSSPESQSAEINQQRMPDGTKRHTHWIGQPSQLDSISWLHAAPSNAFAAALAALLLRLHELEALTWKVKHKKKTSFLQRSKTTSIHLGGLSASRFRMLFSRKARRCAWQKKLEKLFFFEPFFPFLLALTKPYKDPHLIWNLMGENPCDTQK